MKRRFILLFAFVLAVCLDTVSVVVKACPVSGYDEYGVWTLGDRMDDLVSLVLILTVMGVWAAAVSVERLLTYQAAKRQSQEFISETCKAWLYHRNLNTAAWDSKNPLATVVFTVLQDAEEARATSILPTDGCEQVRQRAVALKQMEFKRRLWALEAITWTAPMLGVLGAARGRIDGLSILAYALLIAVPTIFMRKYFSSRVEMLVAELDDSSARIAHSFLSHGQAGVRAAPGRLGVATNEARVPSFLDAQADCETHPAY